MLTNFGQLLEQQRKAAGLSVEELALISRLTPARLQDLERGLGELPNFDTCYRLGQAITARTGKLFIIQDLWLALNADKHKGQPDYLLRQTGND